MDIDTEQGKVQMVPLIAIIACQNTEAAVPVSETFGPHFLHMLFFKSKILRRSIAQIHIIDEENRIKSIPTLRGKVSSDDQNCY